MALKTKLQQFFKQSSKKQNEQLHRQKKAMFEYRHYYRTKFGLAVDEIESAYHVSNELFENWRASYKDVYTDRYDAAWRRIFNGNSINSLDSNNLPTWMCEKDSRFDGMFAPDDPHYVNIVSLNYDELKLFQPRLYYFYERLGMNIASIVMYNQQAETKLNEEQIGEVILEEESRMNPLLLTPGRARMPFKDLPKYKQLDYLKKYYLGESVVEKLQEQDKAQKRDHVQFGDLIF
ncbi:MAG: hypothetical protein MJ060_03330 [Clostridia bacterium]|nr:hypothetical protein [Clostridia bacterium]